MEEMQVSLFFSSYENGLLLGNVQWIPDHQPKLAMNLFWSFCRWKKSQVYTPTKGNSKTIEHSSEPSKSSESPANLKHSKRFCDFPAEKEVIGWTHRLATGHRGCTWDNEIMSCYYHVVVFVRKCICNTSQMIPGRKKTAESPVTCLTRLVKF